MKDHYLLPLAVLIMIAGPTSAQFGAAVDLPSSAGLSGATPSDLNGDTNTDLLVWQGLEVGWLANDGVGNFGAFNSIHLFGAQGGLSSIADMDGNGSMDVVLFDFGTQVLSWRMNTNGLGAFGAEQLIANTAFPPGPLGLACAQLVGDPLPEPILQSHDRVHWWSGATTGSAAIDSVLLPNPSPANSASAVLTADMNGDGRTDILTLHGNGRVYVAYNGGEEGSEWNPGLLGVFFVASGWDQFKVIDLDDDNDLDLLQLFDDRRWAFNGINAGGSTPFQINLSDGIPGIERGAADHFGCGAGASLVTYHITGDWLFTSFDTEIGNFTAPVALTGLPVPTAITSADFNGDGRPDLLIQHDGIFSWYPNELPATAPDPLPPFLLEDVCSTALVDLPGLGTWYGPGVIADQFDAAQIGIGTHELVYSEPGPQGCIASGISPITVVDEPIEEVVLGTFCTSGIGYELPGPDTWSGPGVDDGIFTSGPVGAGTHELIRTVSTPLGCTVTVLQSVTVISGPSVAPVSGDISTCTTGLIEFEASPSGGLWGAPADANGVVDSDAIERPFNGAVSYMYTDPAGASCSGFSQFDLWRSVTPMVGSHGPYCTSQAPQFFTINGAFGGGLEVQDVPFLVVEFLSSSAALVRFDPSVGPGEYPFTATATAPMACSTTVEVLIVVAQAPAVQLDYDVLCSNHPPHQLGDEGSPAGGAYFLDGATEPITELDPAILTGPSYELTYVYTDPATDCSGSATTTFTVEVCVGVEAIDRATTSSFLFPNPVSSGAVRLSGPANARIRIFDVSGKLIETLRTNQADPMLDVSGLAPGTYVVRMEHEGAIRTERLVVE